MALSEQFVKVIPGDINFLETGKGIQLRSVTDQTTVALHFYDANLSLQPSASTTFTFQQGSVRYVSAFQSVKNIYQIETVFDKQLTDSIASGSASSIRIAMMELGR